MTPNALARLIARLIARRADSFQPRNSKVGVSASPFGNGQVSKKSGRWERKINDRKCSFKKSNAKKTNVKKVTLKITGLTSALPNHRLCAALGP